MEKIKKNKCSEESLNKILEISYTLCEHPDTKVSSAASKINNIAFRMLKENQRGS